MLVLSRKKDQKITIGDDIEVTVLSIQGGRVKLGFSCPPEVTVHRQELKRRIGPCQTLDISDQSLAVA